MNGAFVIASLAVRTVTDRGEDREGLAPVRM
jgi:hypothetical protein